MKYYNKNKKILENDPSRKKLLLRINNEIYESITWKAKEQNKSITYVINELLMMGILVDNMNN